MTLLRQALAVASLSLLLALPAAAQEAQCYRSDGYLVVARERSEDVGIDFIVKTLTEGSAVPKCSFAAAAGDFVLDDPNDPLWYAGLAGHYLVLTRSTGPDGDVVIYDLARQQAVIDTPADDTVTVTGDKIRFWPRFDEATADNCPQWDEYQANGLGAIIAKETVLNATSGKSKQTGAVRCSATQ